MRLLQEVQRFNLLSFLQDSKCCLMKSLKHNHSLSRSLGKVMDQNQRREKKQPIPLSCLIVIPTLELYVESLFVVRENLLSVLPTMTKLWSTIASQMRIASQLLTLKSRHQLEMITRFVSMSSKTLMDVSY